MSQLTALKCNTCGFTSHSKENINMDGWATIGFIVRIRGSRTYEESKKPIRKKIVEALGTKLHVCPGCVELFAGNKMNMRMIGENV